MLRPKTHFLNPLRSRYLARPIPDVPHDARGFVPTDEHSRIEGQADAYLAVKGVRDLTYGLVGLALLAFAGASAEAWFMLVVALAPLGDTVIVLRHGGSKATAFGIHFATAVVVLTSAALLFAL